MVSSFVQPVYYLFCKLEQHLPFFNLPFSNIFHLPFSNIQLCLLKISDIPRFRGKTCSRAVSTKQVHILIFIMCYLLYWHVTIYHIVTVNFIKIHVIDNFCSIIFSEKGSSLELLITALWNAKNLFNNSAFSLKFAIGSSWRTVEEHKVFSYCLEISLESTNNSLNWFQD